jgi:prophage tail gpP-like protein
MSTDTVELLVGGKSIKEFHSYSVTSNLFNAADAFDLEFASPKVEITPGENCTLLVNGVTELKGIIERVNPSYNKDGSTLKVSGRDIMGVVVSSHVTEFVTLKDKTLKDLAEELLKDAEHVNRAEIIYGKGSKLKVVEESSDAFSLGSDYMQVEPGESIFDVLNKYARARGLLFFADTDGTLVFNRPANSGPAEFQLIHRLPPNSQDNNVLTGDLVDDITEQYSPIIVMGQRQATVSMSASDVNVSAEVTKRDGFALEYTVKGHSQNGKNWHSNTICKVEDEAKNIEVNDNYLTYSRTFRRSKEGGATTTVRLSRLGVKS